MTTAPVNRPGTHCEACGYDMEGLPIAAACPECGGNGPAKPPSYGPKQLADPMYAAPRGWLNVQLGGAYCLLIALPSLLATAIAAPFVSQNLNIIALMLALLWQVGVFLVTRPRPRLPNHTAYPAVEWMASRTMARMTQFAWVALVAMLLFPPYLILWQYVVVLISFGIIGTLGLIPLCVYLGNLALWGSEFGLATRFASTAWLVSVTTLFLFVGAVLLALQSAIALGAWVAFAAIGGLGVLITLFYLLVNLFQLQRLTKWALENRRTVERRDERRLERAEAEEQRRSEADAKLATAAPPPPNDPPSDDEIYELDPESTDER